MLEGGGRGRVHRRYFLHGLAVESAEALAEYWHRRVRARLGLPAGQGKRYSAGYPAWPELSDQEGRLQDLDANRTGVQLTEMHQMVPEQRTSAVAGAPPRGVVLRGPHRRQHGLETLPFVPLKGIAIPMITPTDILHGKILIVDDQEENILLLEQLLRSAGYVSFTSTMDSGKVCELHLLNRYDLILLDLQMPGMDGFQVMENLKEIETSGYLPVLVITAQPTHKLRALKAGAKDFVSKPFELAEVLSRVHNMLEVRLLHLETKRLYDRVVAEQKVSERLLLNVVPQSIAERLKGHPEAATASFTELITESYAEVTVLFTDIVEFTKFSEGASAEVLMGVLNDISARFDGMAGNPGRERDKAIGDAYLAAVGLPDPVADHTIRAAHLALDMMEAVDRFNQHSRYQLKVRIGLDTGAAVSGVVGERKTSP